MNFKSAFPKLHELAHKKSYQQFKPIPFIAPIPVIKEYRMLRCPVCAERIELFAMMRVESLVCKSCGEWLEISMVTRRSPFAPRESSPEKECTYGLKPQKPNDE
jgi:hypothetical protein